MEIRMECQRTIIYFSTYRGGVKEEKAGYALLTRQGEGCRIEYHCEGKEETQVTPVYCFMGGALLEGEPFLTEKGQTCCVKTGAKKFLGSEKSVMDIEAVCLCGTPDYYSGGRVDGGELLWKNGAEELHPARVWMDTVTEAVKENYPQPEKQLPENLLQERTVQEEKKGVENMPFLEPVSEPQLERVSLPELFTMLPGLSLPPDGVRQRCCRMELADIARFPKKWKGLEKNHFLLHGYYQYHHLLLAQLGSSQYVLGVPGEFYYREQYMAETFGFSAFYPLKRGNRRRGEFGYWYLYLT